MWIRYESVDGIQLAQNKDWCICVVKHGNKLLSVIDEHNILTNSATISFSTYALVSAVINESFTMQSHCPSKYVDHYVSKYKDFCAYLIVECQMKFHVLVHT
jgi:hypothetical protein